MPMLSPKTLLSHFPTIGKSPVPPYVAVGGPDSDPSFSLSTCQSYVLKPANSAGGLTKPEIRVASITSSSSAVNSKRIGSDGPPCMRVI